MPPTACTAEVGVPSDWALKPSGVAAGGKFRLLFITSTSYNATSSDINHYNRLVQARAAAGHASIRDYSSASGSSVARLRSTLGTTLVRPARAG